MTELNSMISFVLKAVDDKKAFDIKLLNISNLTTIADYFVICSGNSDRQVISISDEVDDKMSKAGYELKSKEGYRTGRWILLDYGDIIVHVFHKEDRDFYNLDRLWVDAEDIEIDNII